MRVRTIIIISIIFILGLGILLYPTASDWINKQSQDNKITAYKEAVSSLTEEDYSDAINKAKEYNRKLLTKKGRFDFTKKDREEYNSLLNVAGDGVMGYIEIPKLGVRLSISHGNSEDVLTKGVGHMEGTSLPIGGESTHAALVGHSGLPNAKIFTGLDTMKENDIFVIHILNQTLTYQVDEIKTVEPKDASNLVVKTGEDHVTLITCVPYAVNTHRLLVRGVRVANSKESDDAVDTMVTTTKEFRIEEYIPVMVGIVATLSFAFVVLKCLRKKK